MRLYRRKKGKRMVVIEPPESWHQKNRGEILGAEPICDVYGSWICAMTKEIKAVIPKVLRNVSVRIK